MLDAVLLSRLQFAITAAYHFLFVPLTIGLVILVAIMETMYARTKNDKYRRMADFWGKLFTINFALGIVTGITMEFQFGTNWSVYSEYMGDIFGSPLAIEALFAFFLESTFIGLWIFGKDKISPKLRAFSMWMVALGTNISALWIITANGFMQAPTGYMLNNGRVELSSFGELISNPYTWYMFVHTIIACYIVGGFFVMGVSAYHLIRNKNTDFFKTSFKLGMTLSIFATTLIPIIGHAHGVNTAKMQPAKAAAMEAVWESGKDHPFHVLQIPDAANEKNALESISIPYLGSFLYTNNLHGEVTGLKDIPVDERPNVPAIFWSFRLMVVIGIFMLGLSWYGFYLHRKNRLQQSKKFLKLVLYSIPLPYIAISLGWIVAEMGRQPWIVYGLMKTNEAVSPVPADVIIFSMVGLFVFYTLLIIADLFLLRKYAIKGPSDETAGTKEHKIAS